MLGQQRRLEQRCPDQFRAGHLAVCVLLVIATSLDLGGRGAYRKVAFSNGLREARSGVSTMSFRTRLPAEARQRNSPCIVMPCSLQRGASQCEQRRSVSCPQGRRGTCGGFA
jgi:hypothetical protein